MRPSREIQLPAALIRIVLVLILTVRSSARGLLSGVGVHVSRIRVVVCKDCYGNVLAPVFRLSACTDQPIPVPALLRANRRLVLQRVTEVFFILRLPE